VVVPDVPGAGERLREVLGTDAGLSGFLRESLQFRGAAGTDRRPLPATSRRTDLDRTVAGGE
jgi:hypothetical protein